MFNKDDSNENRVVDVVLFLNLRCNPSWKVYLRVCVCRPTPAFTCGDPVICFVGVSLGKDV